MPLPRYVERRWRKRDQAWSYLFNVPSWAKKLVAGDRRGACSVESEALGTDYAVAVNRAETVLLPQFDAWRTGGLAGDFPMRPPRGSFDWMVSLYRGSPQYVKLSGRQKGNYEYGMRVASDHALKKNPKGLTRFGELRLADISPGVVDKLYASIKVDRVAVATPDGKPVIDAGGNPVMREVPRLRRAQEAMKACRRAWNVALPY